MKQPAPTIALLDRWLQQVQIPLDRWHVLVRRAIHEDRPVRDIVIEALRQRLRRPSRKRPSSRSNDSLYSSARSS